VNFVFLSVFVVEVPSNGIGDAAHHFCDNRSMATVSDQRWREAQQHEREFWQKWRLLPAYRGLDLERYWAGERRQFGLSPDFFAGRRVLDAGCGPVGLIHFLPEAALRVRLDPLLPEYDERLALPEPQLSLAASAESLPLRDASVDVCICFNALDHMKQPDAALAEMHRALRPGGALLVMVHDFPGWVMPLLWADRLHPHHWTHAAAARLLGARFRVVRARRMRRRFDLPFSSLLRPSGWKYLAGNFVLSTSYFTAEK
jgi:SAM-dependent methyltransferase